MSIFPTHILSNRQGRSDSLRRTFLQAKVSIRRQTWEPIGRVLRRWTCKTEASLSFVRL
ncbi:hypothetical protein GGTG_00210 [Gaeumannomyces tritici R3-111a-1]|uniref:Uncharacterized protein n=1 Tax=Gaeumannomyces tritici (strain R3-111a-1) TaxID=644352 RepID=J3NG17_GAET3|nr:hypothetical protein GGTG_00210 [Gaeumannomyces tritici R3-111a-1]EJT80207.1 hypothetical protein GGTG_00210 [Gaeumannomyces tritici R3-111a-1]